MASEGDRACNLECVKKPDDKVVHEFTGPVKIVLVDPPPGQYRRRTWATAFITLAYFFMGATIMTIFFYVMSFPMKFFETLHVLLCTLGYQLFAPAAILTMNTLNASSFTMKESHRKAEHFCVEVFALLFGISGSLMGIFLTGGKLMAKLKSPHCIAGMAAGGLMVFSCLLGPCAYIKKDNACKKCSSAFHMMFGSLGFLSSSVCFIMSLGRNTIQFWYPLPEMYTFLIIFCCFYTTVALFGAFVKYWRKFFC